MENSERLGRQARPGFEPGTSRLPVLSVTTVPVVELFVLLLLFKYVSHIIFFAYLKYMYIHTVELNKTECNPDTFQRI